MVKFFIFIALLIQSPKLMAQNNWGPITRPFTRLHSAIAPNSVGFENNLMNHISDDLRLDSRELQKNISCRGDGSDFVIHKMGGRTIPIKCSNDLDLEQIRSKVSEYYGDEIGMHLKYAFRSGPFLFAVCNYDDKTKHTHHNQHYVCRTPIDNFSKIANIETYCYNMGTFHRTCNPHKALVSTEIILLNSRRRWSDLDRQILLRFLQKSNSPLVSESGFNNLIRSLKQSNVIYSDYSRGSSDSISRYPKVFLGEHQLGCIETLEESSQIYLTTNITCGLIKRVTENQTPRVLIETVYFNGQMQRLKQYPAVYPMLGNEFSSLSD